MTSTDRLADQTITQYDPQAEQIVLGAMMLAPVAITAVIAAGVETEHFGTPRHAVLFDAILAARREQVPTDAIGMTGWLLDHGQIKAGEGAGYLSDCIAAVPTVGTVDYYANRLIELADRRRMLVAISRVSQAVDQGITADHLHSLAETVIRAAAPHATSRDLQVMADLTPTALRDIEMRPTRPPGLRTGFLDLDRLLGGGLQPGQLAVVAGRPGMGKTIFGLGVAQRVSVHGTATSAFFSMEMPKQQLFDRMLSAESGIPHHVIRAGTLSPTDWERATVAAGRIASAALYIDDTSGQTVPRLITRARRLQAARGLDLIVVDYLGLLSDPVARREGRQQEVAKVSRDLKAMAMEIHVPIIALHQLNREPAGRADRVPQLTDLRDSGEIEQAADIVIMIHREDYYEPASPRGNEADLLVRKNRSGATGEVTVAAQLHLARFVDLARE